MLPKFKRTLILLVAVTAFVLLYFITAHLQYSTVSSRIDTRRAELLVGSSSGPIFTVAEKILTLTVTTSLASPASFSETDSDGHPLTPTDPRSSQNIDREEASSLRSQSASDNVAAAPPPARHTRTSAASTSSLHVPNSGSKTDDPFCTIPQGGYKAWQDGVVTVLKPIISRNCTKLFAGDQAEANRTKNASKSWTNTLSDGAFLLKTSNCSWLREELNNNLYNTALEREFPMAYIFIINSRPQSVFRNLKLLYRQQNTFCVNFDSKSSSDFKRIFTNIERCFDNILISSKQENIVWGSHTIMEAQMDCHYDLLKLRESQPPTKKWKYVINLCGKELPLMSPHEMVARLSVLNGSSSIIPKKVTSGHVHDWERIRKKMKVSWWYGKAFKSNEDLGHIPLNLTFYKSSSYSILSPNFVRFLVTDPIAMETHHYFKQTQHSEEHFYATLFMMPGAPGGYNEKLKDLYVRAAHSTWILSSNHEPCQGSVFNSICIVTGGDLPMVMRMSENRTLFHNKYFDNKDHTAMDCLEERIVEKNKLEYEQDCLR